MPARPRRGAIARFRGRQGRSGARRHLRRSALRAARQAAARQRCASIPPRACSGWFRRAGGAARQSRCPAPAGQAIDRDAFRRCAGRARARPPARPCSSRASTAFPRRPPRRGSARRSRDRLPALRRRRDRLFGKTTSRRSASRLPEGPGADLLFAASWCATGARSGFTVERAAAPARRPISR